MIDSEPARRQLGALRSLLERAPVYRAVSGPTALVGGLLSLGGFATAYYAKHHRHQPLSVGEFRIVWLTIFALTVLANLIFLWRGAFRRPGPFLSPARRFAWRSLAPAFFAGAVLTFLLHHPIQLGLAWISFYGLALLGTQAFAPRPILVLGGLFLATGCGLLGTWRHFFIPPGGGDPSALVVSGLLAATFGGFHLAYAAGIWAFADGQPGIEPIDEA
jgi:hypothetical protein